jgi:hypothetical protein
LVVLARGKGAGEPAEDEWLQAIFGVKGSKIATVQSTPVIPVIDI